MYSGDTSQRTVTPNKRGSTQGIVFGYNEEPIEEGLTQPEKGIKLMTTNSLVTCRPPAGLRTPLPGVCSTTGPTRLAPGSEGRRRAPGMSDISGWLEAFEVVKVDDELARSRLSLYLNRRMSPGDGLSL